MKIMTFNDNEFDQNIYLYFNEVAKEGVIIDSGCSAADEKAVIEVINKSNIEIKAILLTHGHYDHIIAVKEMKRLTGSIIFSHESEMQVLETPDFNLSNHIKREIKVTPDKLFCDGDVFEFAGITLKALHTPGHTMGCVCYYDKANGNLFAGDTLFRGAVGRTDLPSGNHATLLNSIAEKLLILPEDTKVYPGHGRSTDIGYEKKHNQFLRHLPI